jgi:hypothetical protein
VVLNHDRVKKGKWKPPIQFIGKDFKLHTVKRKRPVLKKLGNDKRMPLIGSPKYKTAPKGKVRFPFGHLPQLRRGGVMKNRHTETPGVRTLTSGNRFSRTVTIQQVTDLDDTLSNVLSVRGDHKHPNNQRYTKTVFQNYRGKTTRDSDGGFFSYVEGTQIQNWDNIVWPAFPNTTVFNKALSRLYDHLRGDIDLSIDLAESHKTKSMMRDTVRAMSNLALTFRKMKRSNPRDWGNLWLEYTYGWKPLASSIFGAANKLIVGPQGPRFLVVSGKATEVDANDDRVVQASFGVNSKNRIVTYRTSRCKFVCRYNLLGDRLEELAGFTSLNPVSIAWELTPYSFVVDWFLNVGGYLRDFENSLLYHSSFVDGYVTETSRGQARAVLYGSESALGTTNVWQGEGWEVTVEKKRSVLSGSPTPRPPRFDPHLGASRLVSGAALLGQMLHSLEHPKDPKVGSNGFELAEKRFANVVRSIRRDLNAARPIRK